MNIAKVIALIATLHGNCPAEVSQDAPQADFDRTTGVDATDLGRLCARKPDAVICRGHQGHELSFADVARIDEAYRARFHYSTYADGTYRWENWTACGECGDYSLTLSELLALAGEDGRDMHVLLVNECGDDGCDAHMRLWVRTGDRGLIEVDNQHGPDAPHWSEGEYTGFITLDGARRVLPLPGWHADQSGTEWRGK